MFEVFLPFVLIFALSYLKNPFRDKLIAFTSLLILLPAIKFLNQNIYLWGDILKVDKLNSFIFLIVSIVGIAVMFAMVDIDKRIEITQKQKKRFYRFFAIFWIGLLVSILANNMGVFWVGVEFATLSTVYMIKLSNEKSAEKEAWNYMIVGAIAISIMLFGIIMIYASFKDILGEEAMNFDALIKNANRLNHKFLFEIGFIITAIGMFIKMGFFPMNLWLANIERASIYTLAAIFSGILESAIIIGFFKLVLVFKNVNEAHLITFGVIYSLLTLFIVSFLIYRSKDFVRLFSLSGIEHMALISIFWVSGAYFAALLHLAAHTFLKPALFLSAGVFEQSGKYRFKGVLRNFEGISGKIFVLIASLLMLAIISLPPSPMFFSELYGFSAMVDVASHSKHLILMYSSIILLLGFLSIIFYKFVEIYQDMLYVEDKRVKKVYSFELIGILILFVSTAVLLISFEFIRGIV